MDREELLQKVSRLPTSPGVYLHRNSAGVILYVGKAKNLRARVKSYFQEGRPVDAKTRALQKHIADVDVILTDTEPEALLLENTLIKEHRPKYNILLRDDKTYPYICVTAEPFPRIFKTRRLLRDGSTYYGPYSDGTYVHYVLKTLRSLFPLRSCDLALTTDAIAAGRFKVCLDYHIKKCEGPCEGYVSQAAYNVHIKHAMSILSGRTRVVEQQLEQHMHALATQLRFEDAEVIRRRLEKLREYSAKQKVVSSDDIDRDVFAIARIGPTACATVLEVREGRLVGKRQFMIPRCEDISDADLLESTLEQWYLERTEIPREILLPWELPDPDIMQSFFAHRGIKVDLGVPRIGDKRKLVQLALTNADLELREYLLRAAQKDQSLPRAVLSLQRDLRLQKMPRRIECYDNSHMQGSEYVSSRVVFIDGKPRKSEYRRYKMQSVEYNNDFEAMKEVLKRRFAHTDDSDTPDLLVIDGGKGQLSAAMSVLRELGRDGGLAVVALAKRLEEVFVPDQSDPIILPRTSSSLRLLQQARDEAHRFAVQYHRTLRSKRTLQTELTQIPGIGTKTAEHLLIHFGSVERVREATLGDLEQCVGLSRAESVYHYFHDDTTPANSHPAS
jgi:excinuclease ABC subunit C